MYIKNFLKKTVIVSLFLLIFANSVFADAFIYKPPRLNRVVFPTEFNVENLESVEAYIENTSEVNAYAGYVNGKPVIGIGMGMLRILHVYSYYVAIGELHDPQYGLQGTKFLALMKTIGSGNIAPQPIPELPPGHKKAKIEKRAGELFEAMAFVILAHEAGHHLCGHVKQAYTKFGYDPRTTLKKDLVARMNSRAKEYEADTVAAILTLQEYGKTGAEACLYVAYLFETAERIQGTPIEFFKTHPNWENRRHYMNRIINQHKHQYYR
jgi:hypothetical protein